MLTIDLQPDALATALAARRAEQNALALEQWRSALADPHAEPRDWSPIGRVRRHDVREHGPGMAVELRAALHRTLLALRLRWATGGPVWAGGRPAGTDTQARTASLVLGILHLAGLPEAQALLVFLTAEGMDADGWLRHQVMS